jgi:hypothetical protein
MLAMRPLLVKWADNWRYLNPILRGRALSFN